MDKGLLENENIDKCSGCQHRFNEPFTEPCKTCLDIFMIKTESIWFRKLNGLKPTLNSCTAKVYEEIGELMQLLGKGQQLSGEQSEGIDYEEWVYRVIEEALDGAQSLVTLIFAIAEENNVDVQDEVGRHEAKLVAKGYLKE